MNRFNHCFKKYLLNLFNIIGFLNRIKCFNKFGFLNKLRALNRIKFLNLETNGNLSLEFILISIFMILILSSVLFPLANLGIDNSLDVYNSVSSKNEILKLCSAIDYCYYSGKGSKKVVYLNFNENTLIKLSNYDGGGLATSKLSLNQNSFKYFKLYFDCPLINDELKFSKGFNKIFVEWPENSDYIILVH